jgi:hypothetical protein
MIKEIKLLLFTTYFTATGAVTQNVSVWKMKDLKAMIASANTPTVIAL